MSQTLEDQNRINQFFLDNKLSNFTIREVAGKLKMTYATASRRMADLKKAGVLTEHSKRKENKRYVWAYTLAEGQTELYEKPIKRKSRFDVLMEALGVLPQPYREMVLERYRILMRSL